MHPNDNHLRQTLCLQKLSSIISYNILFVYLTKSVTNLRRLVIAAFSEKEQISKLTFFSKKKTSWKKIYFHVSLFGTLDASSNDLYRLAAQ